MPTYEYECTKCGTLFELFQSIKEPPRKRLKKDDPRACRCDAPVSRRISTGGGLIFKGSGFYLTDYRSDNYKQAAKADGSSGESKSDDKGKKEGGDATAPAKSTNETKAETKSTPAPPKKSPKRPSGKD